MSKIIHSWNLYLIVVAVYCINISCVYGQEKNSKQYEQIELKEFYDTKGVIFPSDYEINISTVYHRPRFTPSVEEIARAEKILSKIVNMILGGYKLGKELADKNMRSYYRQYVGVIKENHNKLILLSMLDFSDPGTYEVSKDWQTSFVCWFGQGINYRYFVINIDTGEIDEDSFPVLDEHWFLKRSE